MAEKFEKLGADAAPLRAISARITNGAEQHALTAIAADAILWRRRGRTTPAAQAAPKPVAVTPAPVAPAAVKPALPAPVDPDDASDIVALAERVGLKGFAKPAAGGQAAPQRESAETPDEGLGELLALAARVGLKGFTEDKEA